MNGSATVIGVSTKAYLSAPIYREWLKCVVSAVHDSVFAGTVFVAPGHPFLVETVAACAPAGIAVCAQDVSRFPTGGYTGEVSAALLAELGVSMVELGHAERRQLFGETDAVVAEKVARTLESGLVPLLCIGEESHMSARAAAAECVRQVRAAGLGPDTVQPSPLTPLPSLVLAYEPVWAIGAQEPAPDEHVREVVDGIRAELGEVTVIYAGSAGPGLFSRVCPPANGLFLGRFAHRVRDFETVLREAAV